MHKKSLIDLFLVEQFKKEGHVDTGADREIVALHSGNIGDILYSLPVCWLLNVNHFVLNILEDPSFRGRELREGAARAFVPLLLAQEKINTVSIIRSNSPWEFANLRNFGIDYNLDSFRLNASIPYVHLVYQHALPFNMWIDASKPWLTIPDGYQSSNIPKNKYLAVSLTPRYRRYQQQFYEDLLKDIPSENIYFIGTEKDQAERCNLHGNVFKTNSFVELAAFIDSSSLFIGNPSFPNAIAEALKKRRLIEVPENGNAYPLDSSGTMLHLHRVEYLRELIFEQLNLETHRSIIYSKLITELESLKKPDNRLIIDLTFLKKLKSVSRRFCGKLWRASKSKLKPILTLLRTPFSR